MGGVFYLHEDEWGMIVLMPAENIERAREVAEEARAFGEAHKAPDGVGWTDIYVVPEEKHPISERGIRLEVLRGLVGGRLVEAERVESGYSSYREVLEGCFAFGEGYGDEGAFYGSVEEGVVERLNMIRPGAWDEERVAWFEGVLGELGRRYELILADWWWDVVVDLRDGEMVGRYLRAG